MSIIKSTGATSSSGGSVPSNDARKADAEVFAARIRSCAEMADERAKLKQELSSPTGSLLPAGEDLLRFYPDAFELLFSDPVPAQEKSSPAPSMSPDRTDSSRVTDEELTEEEDDEDMLSTINALKALPIQNSGYLVPQAILDEIQSSLAPWPQFDDNDQEELRYAINELRKPLKNRTAASEIFGEILIIAQDKLPKNAFESWYQALLLRIHAVGENHRPGRPSESNGSKKRSADPAPAGQPATKKQCVSPARRATQNKADPVSDIDQILKMEARTHKTVLDFIAEAELMYAPIRGLVAHSTSSSTSRMAGGSRPGGDVGVGQLKQSIEQLKALEAVRHQDTLERVEKVRARVQAKESGSEEGLTALYALTRNMSNGSKLKELAKLICHSLRYESPIWTYLP